MSRKALPRHGRLADLAGRQHGVVSIGQLQALGYSHDAVDFTCLEGRLHRLHQGVYAVGHTDLSLHGRCLAAVLGCGEGALLSHWSAARLWGLMPTHPLPIHVSTPIPRHKRTGLLIHRSRTFGEEDAELRMGIPVTSVARTALDLAAGVRFRSLQRFLQAAERDGLFDLPRFESVLDRNRGHRGRRPLRLAVALYKPPPFTRSGLERRFLDLVAAAGLPRPATGFVELQYELDVYWPQLRFAVELDVFETHGTRLSFEEDRLRQEELKLAGIEIVRITGPRLDREPKQAIERVRRLLAARADELER